MLSFALILTLLQPSRPAAIAGFVVPVIVDAIERQAGGPWPHVRKEGVERVQPTLTHLDPAPAVVAIVHEGRLRAPRNHRTPRIVLGRLSPLFATALAVNRVSDGVQVGCKATARIDVAIPQVRSASLNDSSAVAVASPPCPRASVFDSFDDRQAANANASHVDEIVLHGLIIKN